MKKFTGLLLALILAITCIAFMTSCSGKIKVTFVQDGQDDVVITLEKGEKIEEIPLPVQEDGYTIVWDRTDFSNIEKSVTVSAVKTPNLYTIYYEINADKESIKEDYTKVSFGEEFTLLIPLNNDQRLTFGGWKIKGTDEYFTDDQNYSVVGDVTLVPTWKIAENDDEFSKNPWA